MNDESVFAAVLEKRTPEEKSAFLDAVCADNAPFRARIEGLLWAHEHPDAFLEGLSNKELAQQAPLEIMATVAPARAEQPGALIGPYKLLEQVGEGGMGIVYVAEQTEPVRRRVALKIIKPGMDTKQVIARFEAERQALAMMDHPNIARVLDAGTTEAGRPYFVMELVRGMPVTEYCDKARLGPRQRLSLFADVCQAVQHAHQKGVIHRDLKPSNVMVTTNDGRSVVKVIDFGVAKAVGQQLTERTVYTALTQLVGTPLYMSPEQAELTSHDVDTRSDVYSLGVLLYELLTGQTPFDKERLKNVNFDEMRRIIREDEPPRPSHRISTLSAQASSTISQQRGLDERHLGRVLRGELDWIVMKALEKDRSRRYESTSALASDIQRYLSDEPVLAHPPTTMYRFQKFARKHRPALLTAAAIALCLLLGTTVSAWQAVRATTAEAQATANAAEAQEKTKEATAQRDEAERQRDEVKSLANRLQRTLYAAHMNLAHKAWNEAAVSRVQDLLEQHRPKPGESDIRGFEWHYLQRLCHAELLTLSGHADFVRSVAYSPDGKRLVSTGKDQTARVWNTETGQELLVMKDVSGYVTFSPDGKRLNGHSAGNLKSWDTQTGQELSSHKLINTSLGKHTYNSDRTRLARLPDDRTIVISDAQTGREIVTLRGHTGSIWNLKFSPDGRRLASASADGTARIWEGETGQNLLTLMGHNGDVDSVSFSPDGKRLVTADDGGRIHVWDALNGQELLSRNTYAGQAGAEYSPDGRRIASVGGDRIVKVWDAQSGEELIAFRGHTNMITDTQFSPDGTRLATSSLDGTVKIWDATSPPEARVFPGPQGGHMVCSPDGKHLAFRIGTGWDESRRRFASVETKVCDAVTGKEIFVLKNHTGLISGVAYTHDGKHLLSADMETAKVFDAQSGRGLFAFKAGGGRATFSLDGSRMARISDDTTSIKLWDMRTGQELLAFKGHSNGIADLAFTPDGKQLVTTSRLETKVWDVQSGKEVRSLKGGGLEMVLSPDGKRLAVGRRIGAGPGGVGEVLVWDAQTGQELPTLKGHSAGVVSLAFSPDGKRLATGSGNPTGQHGEVKLWDVESGHELLSLKGDGYGPGVAFRPNGHWLFAHAQDRMLIYDATPLPDNP